MQLLSNLWAALLVAAGSDGVMKAPLLLSRGSFLVFECKMCCVFFFFFGSFLSFSADGYSAAHCDFEVFVRGGELESFCSAIFSNQEPSFSLNACHLFCLCWPFPP